MTELRIVLPDDVSAMAEESARSEGYPSIDEFLAALVLEHREHVAASSEDENLPLHAGIKPEDMDSEAWHREMESLVAEVRARFAVQPDGSEEVWSRESGHVLRERLKKEARERAASRPSHPDHG